MNNDLGQRTNRSSVVIETGQRWRSRDPRESRTVEVVEADPSVNGGTNGYVTVRAARKSKLRASTLRSRYDLISTPGRPALADEEDIRD